MTEGRKDGSTDWNLKEMLETFGLQSEDQSDEKRSFASGVPDLISAGRGDDPCATCATAAAQHSTAQHSTAQGQEGSGAAPRYTEQDQGPRSLFAPPSSEAIRAAVAPFFVPSVVATQRQGRERWYRCRVSGTPQSTALALSHSDSRVLMSVAPSG